jgi:hypothetical protein
MTLSLFNASFILRSAVNDAQVQEGSGNLVLTSSLC